MSPAELTDRDVFFYAPVHRARHNAGSTVDAALAREEYYRRSVEEAQRLGYEVLPGRRGNRPVASVSALVTGEENGRALAERFGLELKELASSGWTLIDQRRAKDAKDAVVALVGDDSDDHRGQYCIVVAWSPAELASELWKSEQDQWETLGVALHTLGMTAGLY